jgi:hypothetical protein
MDTERTYSKSEIRERKLALQRQLDLQQRELDALAKMDEARDALEQVEREKEALARGDAQPEQPAETAHSEPHAIGERSLKILMDHPDTWLIPRGILAEMDKRDWVDTTPELAIQRLRHALRRLAQSNPNVERDETGPTYRYRWRSRMDGYALATVAQITRPAYPVLQRGLADG